MYIEFIAQDEENRLHDNTTKLGKLQIIFIFHSYVRKNCETKHWTPLKHIQNKPKKYKCEKIYLCTDVKTHLQSKASLHVVVV